LTVTVHGDLIRRDESPRKSTLEDFLYGPDTRPAKILRNPQGLAAWGREVFVCDQGLPDVVRVNPATGRVASATPISERPACPVAVSISVDEGRMYVADTTARQVRAYALGGGGRFLGTIAPEDGGELFHPTSVLVSGDTLFIGDRGSRRILRYQPSLSSWLPSWAPEPGQAPLGLPSGLAVTSEGVLLVTDAITGLIHRVDEEGRWLAPIGRRGRAPGEMVRPMGICRTPSGVIAVTDAAKQSVLFFDEGGRFLTEIGSKTAEWRGWTLPMGIACLPEPPAGRTSGLVSMAPSEDVEWLVVSDMLGPTSLTLLSLRYDEIPRRTGEGAE
jgi:DNA-binding beta-propeller fold protein YncE